MQNIIPSSDLRNRYPEISRMLKDTHQPIYITVNGRGDSVILDIEAYQKLEMNLKILAAVAKGEDDIRNGRVGDFDEMMEELRQEFGFTKWNSKLLDQKTSKYA